MEINENNQQANIEFQFQVPGLEVPILELKYNGDILVKGKLIENDKELVDALRIFLETGEKRWKK